MRNCILIDEFGNHESVQAGNIPAALNQYLEECAKTIPGQNVALQIHTEVCGGTCQEQEPMGETAPDCYAAAHLIPKKKQGPEGKLRNLFQQVGRKINPLRPASSKRK